MAGLFLITLSALSRDTTNSAWSVHVWQSNDGLPNNEVTGLAQTDDGYLWVATPNRLARFDGVHFENVSLPRVGAAFYTTLIRSRDGGLWLGMHRGTVVCLNGKAVRVLTNGLAAGDVQSFTEDAEGAVWTTFRGGAVCRIENDRVTTFGASEGLSTSYPCLLALDGAGRIWFAKRDQGGIFANGRFNALFEVAHQVTGLAAASDGGVWVASDHHLFRCDAHGQLQDCGAFDSQSPRSTPLLGDGRDGVWIGTADRGLFHYDRTGFESVPISRGEILSLLKDREQNLWVGTDGGGLCRVTPRTVELEGVESGLPSERVQSLCEDADNRLWATTQNGTVLSQSNGIWQTVIPGHGAEGVATCVAADQHGAVWIGTQSGMLHCWRAGELTTFRNTNGLVGKVTRGLFVSSSGDVWLGEEGPEALQRFREGNFFSFKLPPDLHVIRAIVEDREGSIWVGTSKGILLRIVGDEVSDETANTAGKLTSIRCLYVTGDKALWIGYAGSGLGVLKDGHFKRITMEQGLFNADISQIVADDRGWMWFGANAGIFKVRQEQLEAVADDRASTVDCIHYGANEDLPNLQANYGNSPGALRSHDGRLWMPMLTALAVIDPDKIPRNVAPAQPLLESVTIDNTNVALYGSVLPVGRGLVDLKSDARLRVPPGYHRLEFDFTALNLSAPENMRFRYRLIGFDDNWIEAGTQRDAIFTQLTPGKYQFEVAACSDDGQWSNTKATAAFVVAPFLWQTWWFRLAIAGGVIAIMIAAVRYISFRRLRLKLQLLEQQAALDKERARIAKDLHDDLGTRLTKIVLLSGLAQRDRALPEKAVEHLRKLSTAARHVINALDETVWAVNPRNDTLAHLINYIGQFAVEFLKTAEIRCRIDLPERPPRCIVPAAARHNLFMAVKEALNNIVRHSNATEVNLRIAITPDWLEICVEDNGRGLAQAVENDDADGLRNMRHRVEEIGGGFQIKSLPAAGTKVTLGYPWNGK